MALWGNKDNLVGGDFSPAAPTSVVVVGTASSEFWTAQGSEFSDVPIGTTILLGTEPGEDGFLVIESLLAPDLVRCGKMSGVGTGSFPAVYSEQPISLKNDPGYAEASPDGELGRSQRPVGVSTADIAAGAATTQYGGIHAGWVGVTTYVDMHGNLRVKSETFVAGSSVETGNRTYPA